MTELSPAAFAVWDAAWDCPIGDCKSIEDARRHQIAAALRAAVRCCQSEYWSEGEQRLAKRMLKISDELEAL